MNSKKIKEVQDTIEKTNRSIREKLESFSSYPKIIFLGTNDSDKTSLIYDLINKSKDEENSFVYFDQSCNVVLCNAPEFEKGEGLDHELINSSIINELLGKSQNNDNDVKFIFVVSSDDFKDRSMLQKVTNSFDILEKMIPKQEELMISFGIVISKCSENDAGVNYIKKLNERSLSNIEKWCEFLIENDDHIFTFPKIPNEFKDRERLIRFIQCGYMRNPPHKISLCKMALKQVENLRSSNNKIIYINIGHIFDQIGEQFQKESSSEVLKKSLDKLNQFKNQKKIDTKKFELYLNENICMTPKLTTFLKQINECEIIDWTLDNILKNEKPSSSFPKNLQVYVNKAINQLTLAYNNAKKHETLKKENEEKLLAFQKNKLEQEKQEKEMNEYIKIIERNRIENEIQAMKLKKIEEDAEVLENEHTIKFKNQNLSYHSRNQEQYSVPKTYTKKDDCLLI